MARDEQAMHVIQRQRVQQHVVGVNPQWSTSVSALLARLRWVSIAPLARPVVPEV